MFAMGRKQTAALPPITIPNRPPYPVPDSDEKRVSAKGSLATRR